MQVRLLAKMKQMAVRDIERLGAALQAVSRERCRDVPSDIDEELKKLIKDVTGISSTDPDLIEKLQGISRRLTAVTEDIEQKFSS